MTSRIAALQIGTRPEGNDATLDAIRALGREARDAAPVLVVMPEALLGGYPKGADFGARIGYRLPEGREAYLAYWQQAIDTDGPEVEALGQIASEWNSALVVGAIERHGASLTCSAFLFAADGTLSGIHRKLIPTGSERLVWAPGSGATLPVMETPAGRVGTAICWENYMPRLREALLARGVTIHCAPTVDEREIWQVSMRHIAYESRSFVVSACQVQPPGDTALGQQVTLRDRPVEEPLIRGGSVIVSPLGEVLAGPLYGREGLVVAEIDPLDVIRARYDLDITGHYARPDLFP